MAHRILSSNLTALGLTLPILGGGACVALADDQAKPESSVEARATQVLQQFSSYIAGLDAYSADITQSLTMRSPFGEEDREEKLTLAVGKPNRFALKAPEDLDNEAVVSDGEKFYVFVPMFNTYVESDAPSSLAALFSQVQSDTLMLGGLPTSLLTPIFGPGGPDGDLGTLKSASYVGTERVNGAEAHRLSLVIEPTLTGDAKQRLREEMGENASMIFHVDAWIDAGEQARLHKLDFDLAKMLGSMMPDMFEAMPQMRDMTYEMVMTFDGWKTNDDVSDDAFAFKAPEGADKVASMQELMEKMEQAMAGPSGSPNDLLGEAAPEFEMQMLDGGTLTSAQHKGNDILILDFWATWCGPCIQAMPALMEVADNYKDRNVILYAVNVQEGRDTIESFLKQRNWSLKVPLDRDGSVSRLFKVGGIPQTVIIDKDGTVQAVHVGYSPAIKQQLTSELDTLLAGEKLVTGDSDDTDD